MLSDGCWFIELFYFSYNFLIIWIGLGSFLLMGLSYLFISPDSMLFIAGILVIYIYITLIEEELVIARLYSVLYAIIMCLFYLYVFFSYVPSYKVLELFVHSPEFFFFSNLLLQTNLRVFWLLFVYLLMRCILLCAILVWFDLLIQRCLKMTFLMS